MPDFECHGNVKGWPKNRVLEWGAWVFPSTFVLCPPAWLIIIVKVLTNLWLPVFLKNFEPPLFLTHFVPKALWEPHNVPAQGSSAKGKAHLKVLFLTRLCWPELIHTLAHTFANVNSCFANIFERKVSSVFQKFTSQAALKGLFNLSLKHPQHIIRKISKAFSTPLNFLMYGKAWQIKGNITSNSLWLILCLP